MSTFFLTANSFGRVMPTLLALIISVYLLTLHGKTRRTWLLIGYFIFMLMLNLAYVLAYSIYDPAGAWSWYLASFVVFAFVCKVQFTYHIPRYSFPREARVVLIVSLVFAVGAYLDYAIQSWQREGVFHIENQFFSFGYFSVVIPALGLMAYLWSPVVLLRQWLRHRHKRPEEARAALWFVCVTIVEAAIAFLYTQDQLLELVPPHIFEPLANAGVSFIFLLYVMIYLNISSEPSSFIARLVGLSLVTVMVIASSLGLSALFREEARYDEDRVREARSTLALLKAGVERPESNLSYLARTAGVPAAAEETGFDMTFLYRTSDLPEDREFMSGRLQGSPVGRERYFRLTGDRRFIAYRIQDGDRLLEAGFTYEHYRAAMHGPARAYTYGLLVITVLILLGFPLTIYYTVIGPLRGLLGRLRQAMETGSDPGASGKSGPTAGGENEIEYLSRTFSSMLHLLKEAKGRFYDYSEHLGEVERLVENYRSQEFLEQKVGDRVLICASPAMRAVVSKAVRFADLDRPALVTGETGTGKELIARAIHYGGERAGGPFIPVNCAAVPASLWESEIFGHLRGAFTDARQDRRGRVAEAAGGSLFFDEIGEMPLDMQAKMLRLLQERQYRPIGGDANHEASCRFIFATNRDLEELIQAGKFREDLFYRINVFHIHIPPLRERSADIPLLVRRTLEELAVESDSQPAEVDSRALGALISYPWPGNIRELENVITRSVAGEGLEELKIEHLPRKIAMAERRSGSAPSASSAKTPGKNRDADGAGVLDGRVDFDELVNSYARRLIEAALQNAKGNKTKAAELLGMKRTRLRYRIKELGIEGDG